MYKGNTWQSSSKGQRWTHRYKNLLIEIASSGRSASNCSTLSNKSLDTSRMRQNPQHFRLCFLSPGSPLCCAFSYNRVWMVQLSQRIRQSFSPQPPPTASPSNQGQFSPSDMTTPHPLQAGPRKLKKNDNVKNRVRLDSFAIYRAPGT